MTEVDCQKVENNIETHELDISHYSTEDSDRVFAQIVGCIENIIISEEFSKLQNDFLETYYKEFVDDEENRLEYMNIFKEYLGTLEKHIDEELVKTVPGFDIRQFEEELERRPNQLDDSISEMLSTFWDFSNFKSMFLEYKKMKEGKTVDFSDDILVTSINVSNEYSYI